MPLTRFSVYSDTTFPLNSEVSYHLRRFLVGGAVKDHLQKEQHLQIQKSKCSILINFVHLKSFTIFSGILFRMLYFLRNLPKFGKKKKEHIKCFFVSLLKSRGCFSHLIYCMSIHLLKNSGGP